MMCQQTKFTCKRINSSDNILQRHILIILSVTVTLTLKTANQSFWKTMWLIMIHHHIKFGSKRFSFSEDIIWANIHLTFWNFAVTLTLNTTIQLLHKTLWLMVMYQSSSKRISSSKDRLDTVIFWLYYPSLWSWPWRQQTNLFEILAHDDAAPYQVW